MYQITILIRNLNLNNDINTIIVYNFCDVIVYRAKSILQAYYLKIEHIKYISKTNTWRLCRLCARNRNIHCKVVYSDFYRYEHYQFYACSLCF